MRQYVISISTVLEKFCNDLESAFVLGGAVNCIALKTYCKGCNHLIDARGEKTDTLSTALDTRLKGIIADTIYYQPVRNSISGGDAVPQSKKVKVYFNKYWQICLPENAVYYRQAFWASHLNFFGGDFTDYYMNGTIYAKGRIENTTLNGAYICYYQNGKIQN